MSESFIGEIRIFAGNYAPYGWRFCDGSMLQVREFAALYSLIGTTYGGDGNFTFALPDLRGRVPVHRGDGLQPGNKGGEEKVALTPAQIPAHNHQMVVNSAAATSPNPAAGLPAKTAAPAYNATPDATLNPGAVPSAASAPHNNLQPYLCVNFIISVEDGIYPTLNY